MIITFHNVNILLSNHIPIDFFTMIHNWFFLKKNTDHNNVKFYLRRFIVDFRKHILLTIKIFGAIFMQIIVIKINLFSTYFWFKN